MEHHNPDIYGDIKLATDPGTPGQVITSAGAGNQAVWSAPPSVFSAGMSPPRFVVQSVPLTTTAVHGNVLSYSQEIRLRVQEIPRELLTDPTLVAQIELLRWRQRRSTRRNGPRITIQPGWVHPTHFMSNVSGGTPSGHLGGMRIGQHNLVNTPTGMTPAGDRPSEWPLLGADPITGGVNLPLGPTFGNWFRVAPVRDDQGGQVNAWQYIGGRRYNHGLNPSPHIGVPRVTNVGHFAFRWSVYVPSLNRRITGPMSMPFRLQFSEPLFHYDMPNHPRIYRRIVNPSAAAGGGAGLGDKLEVAWGTPRR